jgi:hypothetical protein
VALTDLIATLAELLLVKRSDCVTGLPTFTLPKLTTDGATLRAVVDPAPFKTAPPTEAPCVPIATEMLPAFLACYSRLKYGGKTYALGRKPMSEALKSPEMVNPDPLAETVVSVNFP